MSTDATRAALEDLARGTWAATVHALGSPMQYRPHGGGAPVDLVGGFVTANLSNQTVVQAYGLGTRIVTLAAADLGAIVPKQFDRVAIAGGLFTVDTWSPVIAAGVTVGWKGYVRGLPQ